MKKYITYKGTRFLSLEAYKEAFIKRFPDKVPVKKTVDVNRFSLWLLTFCLIAVNILSGAHTIPVVTQFYEFDQSWLLWLVGTSGFLGVEGFMFLLMSQERRTFWMLATILLAFTAATTSNLFSTFNIFAGSDASFYKYSIAFVFGLFAPLANLIAGEVVHGMQVARAAQTAKVEDEYKKQMGEFRRDLETQFKRYLSRAGIKGTEDQMLIISGILDEEIIFEEEVKSKVDDADVSDKGQDLLQALLSNGDQDLTYQQIYDKYLDGKKNPNLVAEVKKSLKNR